MASMKVGWLTAHWNACSAPMEKPMTARRWFTVNSCVRSRSTPAEIVFSRSSSRSLLCAVAELRREGKVEGRLVLHGEVVGRNPLDGGQIAFVGSQIGLDALVAQRPTVRPSDSLHNVLDVL